MIEQYDYGRKISREEYYKIQIDRSNEKFSCCRVSVLDAIFIWNVLHNNNFELGPMICMGTRNGREVDLFRIVKNSSILGKIVYLFEIRRHAFSSALPIIEAIGRSNIKNIKDDSVIVVEVNPAAARCDILTASFDELPAEYENTFSVLYSNAFDQSLDPYKTAKEWLRVLRNEAFVVLHYKENSKAVYTDPTGGLNIENLQQLFPGTVVHHSKSNMDQHNPDCLIIRINKPK